MYYLCRPVEGIDDDDILVVVEKCLEMRGRLYWADCPFSVVLAKVAAPFFLGSLRANVWDDLVWNLEWLRPLSLSLLFRKFHLDFNIDLMKSQVYPPHISSPKNRELANSFSRLISSNVFWFICRSKLNPDTAIACPYIISQVLHIYPA